MACSREHIHRHGLLQLIPQLPESLDIASQRGRVTGNIHYPLRCHPSDSLGEPLSAALARRVYNDNVRPDSEQAKGQGSLWGIHTQKLTVFNMIPGSIPLGILYRRLDNLHTDQPFRLMRHRKSYGSRSAI